MPVVPRVPPLRFPLVLYHPRLGLVLRVLALALVAVALVTRPEPAAAPVAAPQRALAPARPDPQRPAATRAARAALEAVGTPYRWGGSSRRSGFDCSGLVMWAYARVGVRLPHNAWSLSRVTRVVPRSRLRPGDLLFFHGYGHVGIYVGRGRMVHAPQSGERVEVIRVGADGRRFEEARRPPPRASATLRM